MIFKDLPKDNIKYYEKMLKAIGSLSKLFSESEIPYLDYRMAENIFCKSFKARNVSREDAPVDAVLGEIGIGIKTFQNNSAQKIAEFNKDLELFKDLSDKDMIIKISQLRNERLDVAMRIYELKEMIYHYVKRNKGEMIIFECLLEKINISKIKNIERKKNIIHFTEGKNKYSFSISKSVLMKKFDDESLYRITIKIIDDPYKLIEEDISKLIATLQVAKLNPFVILPLYSRTKEMKNVHEKSGLNQWNASGRPRDYNEIYIPISIGIHKRFSGFFPPRDKSFDLILPDERILSAKVCQDNSKALMTNPNSALGEWLLRDVLNLKKGELLTYKKLQTIGLDSVAIEKKDNNTYLIDFRPSDTYEEFIGENS